MVLRKQRPPRLDDSNKLDSPTTNASISPVRIASSPSPKRLIRRGRAHSSPLSSRFSSQEPVFSPDLRTSPAFDLMSLEEAKRSPLALSFANNQKPWADEIVEHAESCSLDYKESKPLPAVPPPAREEPCTADSAPSTLMESAHIEMPANDYWNAVIAAEETDIRQYPEPHAHSKNPFLNAQQPDSNPWGPLPDTKSAYGLSSTALEEGSDRLNRGEGYIPMTARLSLLDEPDAESPWADESSSHMREQQDGGTSIRSSSLNQQPQRVSVGVNDLLDGQDLQWGSSSRQSTEASKAENLRDHEKLSSWNLVNADGMTATQNSSRDLLDLDMHGQRDRSAGLHGASSSDASDVRKLDHTQSPAPATSLGAAPSLPDRPKGFEQISGKSAEELAQHQGNNIALDEEAKQRQEQRSETYFIRRINWADGTGKIRESPVLVQNQNGPCPLLALVNALVLRAPQDSQPPIVKALQSREQISLGLLLEALFDELTTHLGPDDDVPDIEALSRFLTMLHTGMNVNPRLTLESNESMGSFLATNDVRLYSTFGIPLIHGWVAPPSSQAYDAMTRVAEYHEDIQLLHFRRQELEDRVVAGGSLTPDEERLMSDIQTIQQFVEVENPTQLSKFGLTHLMAKLTPGSISILFRNDHFSTIYKGTESPRLFTLVADAGYANHPEIVWESLVDMSGYQAEFFSGDFRAVGYDPLPAPHSTECATSAHESRHTEVVSEQTRKMAFQEQSDADYAYALSLQYQEEEQRENARRRTSTQTPVSNRPSTPGGTQRRTSITESGTRSAQSTASPTGRRASRPNQSHYAGPTSQHLPADRSDDRRREMPPPPYEQVTNSPPHVLLPRTPPYAESFRDGRSSRLQRPPVDTRTGPVTSQKAKAKDKDCVVM